MKKLTLLSVCAFALSLGTAHAQTTMDAQTESEVIMNTNDPVDGNKSEAGSSDVTPSLETGSTATIDEDLEANEAANYGDSETVDDEAEVRRDAGVETGSTATIDEDLEPNEAANYGDSETVDDEAEVRRQGADADADLMLDDDIETGTVDTEAEVDADADAEIEASDDPVDGNKAY